MRFNGNAQGVLFNHNAKPHETELTAKKLVSVRGGFSSSFNDSQRGWIPMCGVQSKSSTYGVPQSICCYRDGNVLNIRILNVWMKKRMLEYCASLK
ncbi:unnamed protein product [Larinioides sclopetarius]|uniref:Uncharacterized protein n=1 Tax=Larinioides sclopetarius TaxID=280406 RepID=A0AAV2A964_9ARAC